MDKEKHARNLLYDIIRNNSQLNHHDQFFCCTLVRQRNKSKWGQLMGISKCCFLLEEHIEHKHRTRNIFRGEANIQVLKHPGCGTNQGLLWKEMSTILTLQGWERWKYPWDEEAEDLTMTTHSVHEMLAISPIRNHSTSCCSCKESLGGAGTGYPKLAFCPMKRPNRLHPSDRNP